MANTQVPENLRVVNKGGRKYTLLWDFPPGEAGNVKYYTFNLYRALGGAGVLAGPAFKTGIPRQSFDTDVTGRGVVVTVSSVFTPTGEESAQSDALFIPEVPTAFQQDGSFFDEDTAPADWTALAFGFTARYVRVTGPSTSTAPVEVSFDAAEQAATIAANEQHEWSDKRVSRIWLKGDPGNRYKIWAW